MLGLRQVRLLGERRALLRARQRRRGAAVGGGVIFNRRCLFYRADHEGNAQDGARMTLPPMARRDAAGLHGRGDGP